MARIITESQLRRMVRQMIIQERYLKHSAGEDYRDRYKTDYGDDSESGTYKSQLISYVKGLKEKAEINKVAQTLGITFPYRKADVSPWSVWRDTVFSPKEKITKMCNDIRSWNESECEEMYHKLA